MSKTILSIVFSLVISGLFCASGEAQSREAVSAKEVNGTFRYNFAGKFKGNSQEIKILALGGGKLKVSFDLVYPYLMQNGETMANVGQATGITKIKGDTAIYAIKNEYGGGRCQISIKFIKPGVINVVQDESDGAACGFGLKVSANGIYKKISSAKPTFDNSF